MEHKHRARQSCCLPLEQDPLATRSSVSRTHVLLRDGVRPSVVSKHLISQADDAMPFNIAHLLKPQSQWCQLIYSQADFMQLLILLHIATTKFLFLPDFFRVLIIHINPSVVFNNFTIHLKCVNLLHSGRETQRDRRREKQRLAFCPPPAILVLMYSGPSLCRRALCTAWYSSAV